MKPRSLTSLEVVQSNPCYMDGESAKLGGSIFLSIIENLVESLPPPICVHQGAHSHCSLALPGVPVSLINGVEQLVPMLHLEASKRDSRVSVPCHFSHGDFKRTQMSVSCQLSHGFLPVRFKNTNFYGLE